VGERQAGCSWACACVWAGWLGCSHVAAVLAGKQSLTTGDWSVVKSKTEVMVCVDEAAAKEESAECGGVTSCAGVETAQRCEAPQSHGRKLSSALVSQPHPGSPPQPKV